MYTKIINGRQVFSSCKVIKLDGHEVSNPTAEMIAEAGWQVFVPPIVPPQPKTDPDFSQVMAAVKKMLSTETSELSDEDALDVAALFQTWASKLPHDGKPAQPVVAGERLWYDGKLYKVLQPHTPQSDWTPDATSALYVEVSIVEWPDFVQPTGAHDAYMRGDKMTFEGQHYISLIDNNVYSPAAYPAGWELQP